MIQLIQFPWSTYCMVARRVAQYAKIPLQLVNISPLDRSLPWRLSGQSSYRVPLLVDAGQVIVETDHETQEIAKHLDTKFELGLFAANLEGLQSILWLYIEDEIEEPAFKLNDSQAAHWLAAEDQLPHRLYKERRFGPGCLEQWREQQTSLLTLLTKRLLPFEGMLGHQPFLLGQRPYFVDLDLAAMLDCFLGSGCFEIPLCLPRLREWYTAVNELAAEPS